MSLGPICPIFLGLLINLFVLLPQIEGGASGQCAFYYPGASSAGLTAAHPSLPMGSSVTVTNASNGKSVQVTITDRGPFDGRLFDLSYNAFCVIADPDVGVIPCSYS